jgi:hypothetical protein
VRLDFDRAYHIQKIIDAITRIAYTTSHAVTVFITPFPKLIASNPTQRPTLLRMISSFGLLLHLGFLVIRRFVGAEESPVIQVEPHLNGFIWIYC